MKNNKSTKNASPKLAATHSHCTDGGRIPSRQVMGTKNRHTRWYPVPAFAPTLGHTCPIFVSARNVMCSI